MNISIWQLTLVVEFKKRQIQQHYHKVVFIIPSLRGIDITTNVFSLEDFNNHKSLLYLIRQTRLQAACKYNQKGSDQLGEAKFCFRSWTSDIFFGSFLSDNMKQSLKCCMKQTYWPKRKTYFPTVLKQLSNKWWNYMKYLNSWVSMNSLSKLVIITTSNNCKLLTIRSNKATI